MGTITNHAKKLLLSLFTMLASLLVNAESVTIDNITYNIIKKAGIAEVTKCNSHTSGDLVIPNTIIYDEVEFEVKKIINNAFSWCNELTSVTIPENITSIGYSAFYNCSSLVAVHCNSIASWCNISFGDEDANPLYYAGKLYINNELLTEITIPEGIRSIGDYTFINCDSLTTVNIPESVISIGGYAFSGCGNLTSIIIPEGVSTIKGGTFSDCSSLTTMSIPQSLLKIEKNAFERCEAITNIHITSVEDWLKIEFKDRSSYPHVSRYMIGNHPYVNFYTKGELLTEVVIPETINSIPDYAFYYCNNLTSLTISEGVTKIGDYAFEKCNNINSIILPQSLSSIGESAFRGCEGIIDIYCYAEKLPSIEYNTFYAAYPEYATLHVPANAIEKYRTTSPWSDFGNFETLEVMVEEINLNHSSNILLEGESLSLTVTVIPDDATDGSVIWNSSDSSVATVDNTGKVTAIAPGTATITAMANDGSGVSASCEVTVKEKLLGKCDTPKIGYTDGRIVLTCETEGAKVITTITDGNDSIFEALEFNYIPTQTFTAYASKKKYEDSDEVSITLCWVPCSEEHESEEDGILNIPAKPVFINTQGGTITLSGLAEGTEVAVYTTAGIEVATATATDGTAILTTGIETSTTAIVKIGDYSIKIAIK